MKINIHQTISNVLNKKRELINTTTSEAYAIYPEEGKVLRNKITGVILGGFAYLTVESEIQQYEEISKEDI